MKNKRLISAITAIIFSSLVVGVALFKVPAEGISDVLKGYFMLVGACVGVYGSLQSYTDKQKMKKGGQNGTQG